jgi:hypothetical protein
MSKKSKYGTPVSREKVSKLKRRLPQYDECLKEFLKSRDEVWRVNIDALPSKNIKVILSSLKWRTKNKPEYSSIHIFSRKKEVYLEKSDNNEKSKD